MNNGSLEVFTINDPLPSASIISGNASLCPGGSAEITVKFTGTAPWNFTYTLNGSNPVAVSNVTANPYHLTVTQAGTYLITALSDAYETGSCFSGSATITLKPSPTATLAGPGTAICLGQTAEVPVELTGTAPWSLIYNVNSTIPVAITNITSSPYWLTIDQPGTYTLTSVLDHNCTGSVTVGNAITVNPLPTSTIQSFSDTVCAGTTVNIPVYFTGTSPWTVDYTLDGINTITLVTNSNPYILTVSDPGSYRVISLSDANCTGTNLTGEVNLAINPKPVPAFNFLTNNMMVSFTNHSHHATSYFWNFGDSKTSTSANPMHKYKLPGTYNVVLVASNQACGIVKTKKLVIVSMNDDQQVADSKITGGKVNDTEMNISLYPNPSGGLFTIAFKNAGPSDLTVEILSSTGQLVYRSIVKVPELPEDRELVTDQVDLGHFSGGIYTVKVFSNELMKTEKLILNK
ncbi:MAG: PKD domain-containing protein [Bacteroidetes bacterium]|nr:PKD domain-containing protein [Bacteroidota bacterium]